MQALWSRAAQNPGTCRCLSCVSNAATVARRRGPRALRGSWALGTPTSTFLYTAVFAAGLTMDARAKLDRNRQWERAFEQLREAMDRPLPTRPTRAEPMEEATAVGADGATVMPSTDDVQFNTEERAWDNLRFDSRMPGAAKLEWPANTGRDLVPHHLPPQSLWSPDHIRLTATRRRHTKKKLAMQELTTGLLVHNLIRHCELWRYCDHGEGRHLLDRLCPQIRAVAYATPAEERTIRRNFLSDIEQLHCTHVSASPQEIAKARTQVTPSAVPAYFQDADGDFYALCEQMNVGISTLLRQAGRKDQKEKTFAIAKVCHNLLISTAAPDLQTYNLLFCAFKLWRRTVLADQVIAAFYSAKIRPNEFFCSQVLDHYVSTGRPDDFSRFVARMRGVGDTLMLADPSITITKEGSDRLVRLSDNKVYQKVHPTPMVFGALIDGVVQFAGFDRALDIYSEMKAEGWGLAIPALINLLRDCIRRSDWEGGVYVWEEIRSIKALVKPQHVAKAYHHMLSLCSVTGNTIAFNQVLNEVGRRGLDQEPILKAALRATQLAQHQPDTRAPAWTADNLMIAVSSYVNDATSPHGEDDEPDLDDQSLTQRSSPSAATKPVATDESIDAKEAWSSWVEHEFGEKPKDPEL
ncbi:hypothetical protein BKA63DRAFT_27450 [Paraphoma chrysanthemicola]|nr:hypothetical protein BKA63DRAFT_27450 [Paraphoma chrysanthemicola]